MLSSIQEQLKNEFFYSHSELRDVCNFLISPVYGELTNRDAKIYLNNLLGHNVSFSYPSNREKPRSVFHIATDTGDVARNIQSSNLVKETAVNIKKLY